MMMERRREMILEDLRLKLIGRGHTVEDIEIVLQHIKKCWRESPTKQISTRPTMPYTGTNRYEIWGKMIETGHEFFADIEAPSIQHARVEAEEKMHQWGCGKKFEFGAHLTGSTFNNLETWRPNDHDRLTSIEERLDAIESTTAMEDDGA